MGLQNFWDTPKATDAAVRAEGEKLIRSREKLVGRKAPIEEQFADFHKRNPHVYQALVFLARKVKEKGVHQYGMPALYEVLRYEAVVRETNKPHGEHEQFKLPNSFRSRYARLIMEREVDLRGFFRVSALRRR